MTQPYAGIDHFTFAAQPGGKGVWVTAGLVATGGDGRNAANLMAAVEAAIDDLQFIAWRTMDIVSGGTYAFTTTIHTANLWDFTNEVDLTGVWFSSGTGKIIAGSTVHVGDVAGGVLGTGRLQVNAGSWIKVVGTGKITIDGTTGSAAKIELINGGDLDADASSSVLLQGVNVLDDTGGTIQKGYFTKQGNLAVTKLRVKTLPIGTSMTPAPFTASQADVWLVPTGLSEAYTAQAVAENTTFHYEIRAQNPSTQGGDVYIDDSALTGRLGRFVADGSVPATNAGCVEYTNIGSLSKPRVRNFWDGQSPSAGQNTPVVIF